MKNTPDKPKRKRKRKSKVTLNRSIDKAVLVSPLARTLRPRNSLCGNRRSLLKNCNYTFKVTKNINKELRSIKRVVRNGCFSPKKKVPDTCRISVNYRITHLSTLRGIRLKADESLFNGCTKEFLKRHSITMAAGASSSNPPFNINITFEQMLNIRKKRLNKKHNKVDSSNDVIVVNADISVNKNDNAQENGVNERVVSDPIEITDDEDKLQQVDIQTGKSIDVIELDSTIMDNSLTIQKLSETIAETLPKVDSNCLMEKSVADIIARTPSPCFDLQPQAASSFIEKLEVKSVDTVCHLITDLVPQPQVYDSSQEKSEINYDSIYDRSTIVIAPGFNLIPQPQVNSVEEVDVDKTPADQSVIITTPTLSSVQKLQVDVSEKQMQRPCSPSNNSIIMILDTPDSSQEINHKEQDTDIIFVSEKRQSNCVIPTRKRRLTRNSTVIILDDDDEDKPPRTRSSTKPVTSTCGPINSVISKKKMCRHKRLQNGRKKEQILTTVIAATKTSNPGASELAGCSSVTVVDARAVNQSRATRSSKRTCSQTPSLGTVPEASAVGAEGNGRSRALLREQSNSQVTRGRSPPDLFGSNICNAHYVRREGLREIIIDGSNVAMGHTNGRMFSVRGLQIAIEYFVKRGHKVTAFVPQFRKRSGECSNPFLLEQLADRRFVIFTPSREVEGRRITPYDDRYIIQYATACEGIVVSNDNFRDLVREHPEWRETIKKRILMHTWVDDILMFPEDPLGRYGPNLSNFLRFP